MKDNKNLLRRTKIVATLGPATSDEETLKQLIEAGVDVVRMNFSHGSHEDHFARAQLVRKVAADLGKAVGILADLQGPKIRIAKFKEDKVTLVMGERFALDASLDEDAGDVTQVGVAYKNLPRDVKSGDTLLLNDGLIVLFVDEVVGDRIETTVKIGGVLSNNKGINLKGGGLSAPAITEKDIADMKAVAKIDAEFVAISFVRNGGDVELARGLLQQAGNADVCIVSKVERAEAIGELDSIIDASDVIMVARGDLGIEIEVGEVPAVQKRLITEARARGKSVITATQMMESMIDNPIPTRAEVSDVANAVLDGTDAVMLSGETAMGKYPVETVAAMNSVCLAAEQDPSVTRSTHRVDSYFEQIDEAIALSAMYAANHMDAKAIVALTESGNSALTMSRINSSLPIYAFTKHPATAGRCALYRGVIPVIFDKDIEYKRSGAFSQYIASLLSDKGYVSKGDVVIITRGDLRGVVGKTNTMKIVRA